MNPTQRRVIIATDASINLKSGFAETGKILVIPRQFRIGNKTIKTIEGPTQYATERQLPELLPAVLEDFVKAYRQTDNASIISIHAPAALDDAVQRARYAQNMLSPAIDIHVFEVMAIDGGVQRMVEIAGNFVQGYDAATAEQVLALLQRVQNETTTLVFAKGTGRLPCVPKPGLQQQLGAMFGDRLTLHLDCNKGVFRWNLDKKARHLPRLDEGQDLLLQWRRKSKQESRRLLGQMAALYPRAAHDAEIRQIYLKNPVFPDDFIGLVAMPNAGRVIDLIRWVRRWGT